MQYRKKLNVTEETSVKDGCLSLTHCKNVLRIFYQYFVLTVLFYAFCVWVAMICPVAHTS